MTARKPATATARKERLDLAKVEAEVRHLTAQAELAELKLDQERRTEEDAAASEYEHRIYAFNSDVRKTSVEECIATLGQWARRDPGCSLTLIINSPGGSVLDGFALFDFLRWLSAKGHHITTVGTGMVASMGGILLQAGDTREFAANAQLLIHEVSSGSIGKIGDLEDEVEFCKRLWSRCVSILGARSALTERQIRGRAERKEWWLDADEALLHGFVDAIQ